MSNRWLALAVLALVALAMLWRDVRQARLQTALELRGWCEPCARDRNELGHPACDERCEGVGQ